MEKLVIVTQTVDVYQMQEVDTMEYESVERFLQDWMKWSSERDYWNTDHFLDTRINKRMVNDMSHEDAFEVLTLEEFFHIRKVN